MGSDKTLMDDEEFNGLLRAITEIFNVEDEVKNRQDMVKKQYVALNTYIEKRELNHARESSKYLLSDLDSLIQSEKRLKDTQAIREKLRNFLIINKLDGV